MSNFSKIYCIIGLERGKVQIFAPRLRITQQIGFAEGREQNMREIKTVALIGLGAIGCSLARELCQTVGFENFRVIAGGTRRERLEREGVVINGQICRFQIVSPDTVTEPADLVLVTVKFGALPQAIQDIRNQVGAQTTIISFLNGISSDEMLAEVYGWQRVLYGLVRRAVLMEGNVCTYAPEKGTYYFGEAKNPTVSDRVQPVCDLFARAGLRYQVPVDMVRDIWLKYMGNISENQSAAILGIPYAAWYADGNDANWIREAACREVIAVANAVGIDLNENDLVQQRALAKCVPAWGKPSTLQDLEAGRPTEVEMLAGTLCRLGQAHGVPTPINDLFYHMIRVLEQKNAGAFAVAP